MTVSKRLRYEILRRDNHACRCCGGTAPDVALTVDHVIPVSLGGSDDATNLVAACRDCNAGKSSVPADAAMVDDVAMQARQWSAAMRMAAETHEAHQENNREKFIGWWGEAAAQAPFHVPDPPRNWADSIDQFTRAGLGGRACKEAVRVSMNRPRDDHFSYFCGVAWSKLREQQDIARALLARGDA